MVLSFNEIDKIEDESLPFYEDLQILIGAILEWDVPPKSVESYLDKVRIYLGRDLNIHKSEILNILSDVNLQMSLWRHESVYTLSKLIDSDDETLEESINSLLIQIRNYLEAG